MSTLTEPVTLAQVSRQRRDIVSGAAMDESRLVRFVEDPGGVIVPDLGRRLPGRGLWVAADRASIETAARRGLFARAARKKLIVAADLADAVETLMLKRVLASLGLARKAGELVMGFEKAHAVIVGGSAAFLIEAVDGAADGRRKLMDAFHRAVTPPRLIGLFGSDELGLALGGDNVIHTVFLAGRGAKHWSIEVERLAGFRPLFPDHWGI